MDQTLINWLFTAAGAAFGVIFKIVWDAVRELRSDVKQIERDLPEVYVRKDDFKEAVKEMRDDMREMRQDIKASFLHVDQTLGVIFKKLDSKEDKANV